jgi:hypothetical protein
VNECCWEKIVLQNKNVSTNQPLHWGYTILSGFIRLNSLLVSLFAYIWNVNLNFSFLQYSIKIQLHLCFEQRNKRSNTKPFYIKHAFLRFPSIRRFKNSKHFLCCFVRKRCTKWNGGLRGIIYCQVCNR